MSRGGLHAAATNDVRRELPRVWLQGRLGLTLRPCWFLSAGAGHSQERHEPPPARVHGDVQHETGLGRADGDLPPAHQRLSRQVRGLDLPGHAAVGFLGVICGAATYKSGQLRLLRPCVRPSIQTMNISHLPTVR